MTKNTMIPVDDLVDSVIRQLKEKNYMESTLSVYKRIYHRVKEFMLLSDYQNYTPDVGKSFLTEQKGSDSTMSAYKCAIRRLNDYYSGKEFRSHHENETVNICNDYSRLLEDYLNDCTRKGNKPGTIVHKRFACVHFLNFLSEKGYNDIALINAGIITSALLVFTNPDRYADVRQFLKFLKERGWIDRDYAEIIPHPKRAQPIPSVYTIDEIKLIEQHVDTDSDTGKRNIAIIRLATRMGLRSGDIAKLAIDEIDFSSGTIHLIQEKTGIPLELQMPREVSDSIYTHLESSKKNHYSDRYVFHSMTAPYGRITTGIIRHLVNESIDRAEIEVGSRKHGPHAFRSSLASHMISDNNSYDVARKILGHSDPNVIKHYAKTDIERLRLCAISPPRPSGLFEDYLSGKKVIHHV